MSPELIIFDCDGVLIDSEAIACRADAACLAEIGIAMSAEEIMDRYLGISADTMCADIEQRHGRALPPDFAETLRLRVAAAFEAELMPMAGVEAALRCIAAAPLRRVEQRARTAAPFAVAGGPAAPVRAARVQRDAGGARQAGAGPVPVRRRLDAVPIRQRAW